MILAIEAAESERNQKTRKQRNFDPELATKRFQVGPPLLWAPFLRRVVTRRGPPCLLVRDRGAGWARKMDDFEAPEADFAAPLFEIGGRIIERVAEFNQHV